MEDKNKLIIKTESIMMKLKEELSKIKYTSIYSITIIRRGLILGQVIYYGLVF